MTPKQFAAAPLEEQRDFLAREAKAIQKANNSTFREACLKLKHRYGMAARAAFQSFHDTDGPGLGART